MNTALLVIDPQNIYTDPNSDLYCRSAASTISKINKLIKKFQEDDCSIVLVRHVHKNDGTDLGRMFDFTGEPEDDFNFKENSDEVKYNSKLSQPSKSIEISKNRYSAFVGTELESNLRTRRIDRVVICGFMTNFCCESTARDAHDRDFFVDFVSDATGTPGTDNFDQREIRKIVGELLGAGFARVMSTRACLKTNYK
jgi:nicotinamidase-related amidase